MAPGGNRRPQALQGAGEPGRGRGGAVLTGLHPQAERFLELLASWQPSSGAEPTLEELRRDVSREPYRGERVELPHVADLRVPGHGGAVPARLYRPEHGDRRLPTLLYFHGGGWVIGGLATVDTLCRDLAARVGCAVLSVDYRLAPEHPFPAAVDDARAAVSAAVHDPGRYGVDPEAVAVGGDSSGGNLAAVAAQLAERDGIALAHQLLVYPVTDTALDTPSYAAFAEGYGLDASGLEWFLEQYAAGVDRADPRLAPLRAPDVSGVAPATVITAGCDVLRDEGEAYAARLAAAGVDVAVGRYEGMVHSFFLLPEIFDAALRARAFAVERLRSAFRLAPEPATTGRR